MTLQESEGFEEVWPHHVSTFPIGAGGAESSLGGAEIEREFIGVSMAFADSQLLGGLRSALGRNSSPAWWPTLGATRLRARTLVACLRRKRMSWADM